VNVKSLGIVLGAAVFGSAWTVAAGAATVLDYIATPFEDPLLTRPPRLDLNVVLPGDTVPLPCPVTKDFTQPLVLDEAIDIALCANPQIRSAWAGIKVQAAALGEARATYLPTVSGAVGRIKDFTSFPDSRLSRTSVASNTMSSALNWRLFDFGGRAANNESARQLLIAALANHDAVLQKTLASVIGSYFDAQTALATLQAKEKNAQLAVRTLETAKRKESRGAGARSDSLQATTAVAKASLDRSKAQGAHEKALAVLAYNLGVQGTIPIILGQDLLEDGHESAKTLSAWIEEIQNTHPAIVAARAQLEAAKQKVTATQSDGMPTVDFSLNYYQNGRDNQSLSSVRSKEWVIGVTLNIPIFDGFSRTYKIRGAQAQVEQKRADLEDTEHQVSMDFVKAYAEANSALRNLEFSESLLNAAQDALATTQRKYEKGATDILEILNVQTSLSDAEEQRVQSLADWRAARLHLLTSSGRLGRSDIHD